MSSEVQTTKTSDNLFERRVGYAVRRAQAICKKEIQGATLNAEITDKQLGTTTLSISNRKGEVAASKEVTLTGNGNAFYDVIAAFVKDIAAQVKASQPAPDETVN